MRSTCRSSRRLARLLALVAVGVLATAGTIEAQATSSRADSALAARVQAVLAAASDVPGDSIVVSASRGVVTLTGSVVCADCGGTRTPPGTGTVQQSLGAVVRAIPGVREVRFSLVYRRP